MKFFDEQKYMVLEVNPKTQSLSSARHYHDQMVKKVRIALVEGKSLAEGIKCFGNILRFDDDIFCPAGDI